MAGTFPTLSCGTVSLMYPYRINYRCGTEVTRSRGGAEQRNVVRACVAEFDATYTNVSLTDPTAITGFFASQKGRKDTTWTLNHGGASYTNCGFLDDAIEWTETAHGLWSARLRWRGYPPALTGAPSSLPTLTSGARTQYGWKRRSTFDTQYSEAWTARITRWLCARAG